jgi:hypothetical protein
LLVLVILRNATDTRDVQQGLRGSLSPATEGTESTLNGGFPALSANQRAWLSYVAAVTVCCFVLAIVTHV